MSDNFSWQTEDDGSWDADAYTPQPVKPQNAKPWRLVVLLVLVGVLVVVGLYWHFLRRMDALTAVIESDVRSTHNLLERAVTLQDVELMAPLLSARDLSWAYGQESLLESGLFYGRAPLGLVSAPAVDMSELLPEGQSPFVLEIAPDMTVAEAYFWQPYTVLGSDELVLLQQTAVYRRGHQRWLLSPPDNEFWGGWQTSRTDRLTLVYPSRDSALAQQLADDLTAVVDQSCNEMAALACSQQLRLNIRLGTDPSSVLLLANQAVLYDGNLRLDLPSPTLIGLPLDDVSYEALLRGYAAVVTAVLIQHQAGWDCCQRAPVAQAFVDYQLAQMGLRPWPVTDQTYATFVSSGIDVNQLAPFFDDNSFASLAGSDSWQLYVFVDFLMQQYGLDPLAVLASLQTPQTLDQWLMALLGHVEEDVLFIERLSRDWWLYAHAKMVASQGPRPVSLPAQDLMLTCAIDDGTQSDHTLYRYQPQLDKWHNEFSLGGYMIVSPLVNSSLGALVQTLDFDTGSIQPMVWRDGEATVISSDYLLSWGYGDPTGRYLLLYGDEGNPNGLGLADLENCTNEVCTLMQLSDAPVWSPDGSQTLLAAGIMFANTSFPAAHGRVMLYNNRLQTDEGYLYLADSVGSADSKRLLNVPDGQLQSILPFWLDNQTYGYVYNSLGNQLEHKVMLASLPEDEPQLLISSSDLLQALPAVSRPSELVIDYIIPSPQDSTLLAIVARHQNQNYTFLVDVPSQTVQRTLQITADQWRFFSFSPDGRYLLASGDAQPDLFAPTESVVYHLYDIERDQIQRLVSNFSAFVLSFPFDWSADGNWLAVSLNDGVVMLVAPEYEYQHIVLHNYGNCSSLAWVDTIETP